MSATSGGPLDPAAVVFDLDGTLADSFTGIATALDAALREVGRPARGVTWTAHHVGRGAEALIRDALDGEPDLEQLRAFGRRFGEIYVATYLPATPPVPGALAAVAWVARVTGGRVAVVSNKATDLCTRWLEQYGFAQHVAVVSGPDRSGVRKPEPAAVTVVLDRLGVSPTQALIVGDMDVDLETAARAGTRSVGVLSPASVPDAMRGWAPAAILERIEMLPEWLADHGEGWPRPDDGPGPRGRG